MRAKFYHLVYNGRDIFHLGKKEIRYYLDYDKNGMSFGNGNYCNFTSRYDGAYYYFERDLNRLFFAHYPDEYTVPYEYIFSKRHNGWDEETSDFWLDLYKLYEAT